MKNQIAVMVLAFLASAPLAYSQDAGLFAVGAAPGEVQRQFFADARQAYTRARPSFGGAWTGHSNFFIGQKQLNSDWGDLDNQMEVAWINDFRGKTWPVSIAADLRYSFDKASEAAGGFEVSASGDTFELNLGARKVFGESAIRPYIGAGPSFTRGDISVDVSGFGGGSVTGYGVGLWADAGISVDLSRGFSMGIEAAYTKATVDMDGTDFEAGGFQIGISLGGSF